MTNMMLMGYKLSLEASADLENIWLYTFETWSKDQADRYVNLSLDEIEYLADSPLSGKDCSSIRKNYRSSKVKSHIIFYRHLDAARSIEVIRVLHQKMDIERRLND